MNGHEQLELYFNEIAALYSKSFGEPSTEALPFQKDSHKWLNYFYKSPPFRHIHLEYYSADKICALHSNIFPNPLVDVPILGFDAISIGGRVTGLFFDFTPTVSDKEHLKRALLNMGNRYKSPKRSLPEWGTFFSTAFFCVSPTEEELPKIMDDVKRYIGHYLIVAEDLVREYNYNIDVQKNYCDGQKQNDKTFKALAVEIGEDNAKLFLDKYLFPEVEK